MVRGDKVTRTRGLEVAATRVGRMGQQIEDGGSNKTEMTVMLLSESQEGWLIKSVIVYLMVTSW